MAKVKTKVRFAGAGAFIQLLGVLTPIVGGALLGVVGLSLGVLLGIVLFLVGSSKSKYCCCSECGNRVDGKHVKICPICRVEFGTKATPGVTEAAVPPTSGARDAVVFIGGAAALCLALLAYQFWGR